MKTKNKDTLIADIRTIANKITVKIKQLNTLEYELAEIKALLVKTNNIQSLQSSSIVKGFEVDNLLFIKNLGLYKLNTSQTKRATFDMEETVKQQVQIQLEISELSKEFDQLIGKIFYLESCGLGDSGVVEKTVYILTVDDIDANSEKFVPVNLCWANFGTKTYIFDSLEEVVATKAELQGIYPYDTYKIYKQVL